MSRSVLVVDIGNTNAKAGVVRGTEVTCVNRFSYDHPTLIEDLREAYASEQLEALAIASVVPDRTPQWESWVQEALGLASWQFLPTEPQPIGVDVPKPSTVGADRLANAVAAVHRVGAPVMVADFGTALTFDVAAPERGYIGGVIAPGIDLMYRYFHEKTALLPNLSFEVRSHAIGATTEDAMHAGAFFGYRGMVRELSAQIREELGSNVPLFATGGYAAEVLKDFGESVEIVPHLTLEGIALGWQSAHEIDVR